LVDLDGDGILDIVSGSWPGELYFFKGKGKGEYAAGEKLKDKNGNVIKLGSASTVFAVDWNGDGKLDLLIGCIEGDVYLMLNEGEGKNYAFGAPQKLAAADGAIKAPHGDSHPIAADWDRDGKLDLILGCGDGSVVWYRNVGTSKEPKLAAAQTLVPKSTLEWSKGLREGQHGVRAKVCVVDWNGDGWLDLVVGDFGVVYGEAPKMTDDDKAKLAKAEKFLKDWQEKYTVLANEAAKLAKAPPNETAEAAQKRKDLQAELQKEMAAQLNDQWREAQDTVRRYQAPQQYTGHVWLYLRQPDAK
jgi:hypothetical protein